MQKTCRKCRQKFTIPNLQEDGETPDTVFCPSCAETFKKQRREWDRELMLSERTDMLPDIRKGVGFGERRLELGMGKKGDISCEYHCFSIKRSQSKKPLMEGIVT